MQFYEERLPVKIHNVAIDSRMRDKGKYSNPADYVIDFPHSFKNVVYVELVLAIYEKFGTEQYVNLYIEELSSNLISNNNIISGAFTQLPLTKPLNRYHHGLFQSIRIFEQPLSKLGRLSIRFISHDGSLYPIKEHYLRFEVACCKYDASLENKKLEVVAKHAITYTPYLKTQLENIVKQLYSPNEILEVPEVFTLQGLIDAFRRKTEMLKMRNAGEVELREAKEAFKTLAHRFKK